MTTLTSNPVRDKCTVPFTVNNTDYKATISVQVESANCLNGRVVRAVVRKDSPFSTGVISRHRTTCPAEQIEETIEKQITEAIDVVKARESVQNLTIDVDLDIDAQEATPTVSTNDN